MRDTDRRADRRGSQPRLSALVLACLAVATVLTSAACSSSSGASPGSSRSAGPTGVSTSPSASPTASASAQPVLAPPDPGPGIERHLTAPAGARKLSFDDCELLGNTVPLFMQHNLFAAPTRALQMAVMPQLVDGTQKYGITPAENERKAWLAAGYGADFATVKDLDNALVYLKKIKAAAVGGDLDAMPALYTGISKAIAQLDSDTQDKFCNT